MTRSKYGNTPTELDGIRFASQLEANRYRELTFLQRAGLISDLATQPPFRIHDGFRDNEGKWQRPIVYIGDFRYVDEHGRTVVEDTKGKMSEAAALKIKLFKAKFPEIKFVLVRG